MRRGGALFLGGVVLAAAIVFASRPLGVAGLGLLLAAGVARLWVALAGSPVDIRTTIAPDPATEGDEVTLRIEARRGSRLAPRLCRRRRRSRRSERTSAGSGATTAV